MESAYTQLQQAILGAIIVCNPLLLAKQSLMAGDWLSAIRYLQTVDAEIYGDMTAENALKIRQLLLDEERARLKERWATVFGGAVAIDFVCRNPDKMQVLKEAMQASDLVPMSFNIQPTQEPDRVRVSIEI